MQSDNLGHLIHEIIRRADENRRRLGGSSIEHIRAIKAILRRSEVVFGVYPTERTSSGFQFMIVKGTAALDAARENGRQPGWDAIPCRSSSEAEAIERVLGDLAKEIWRPQSRRLRLPPPVSMGVSVPSEGSPAVVLDAQPATTPATVSPAPEEHP